MNQNNLNKDAELFQDGKSWLVIYALGTKGQEFNNKKEAMNFIGAL